MLRYSAGNWLSCQAVGVYAGDYGLVLGVTTMSIIGVSAAVLLIDLVYPLLDPRVEAR